MIRSLRLERFKGFRDATLRLGPLTCVVGANASGKSNLRDACRFLHGVGRGYTLAEIVGEKWSDTGDLVWSGIRGGIAEIGYQGAESFALTATLDHPKRLAVALEYRIEVERQGDNGHLRVRAESLFERVDAGPERRPLFATHWPDQPVGIRPATVLPVRVLTPQRGRNPVLELRDGQPALTQLQDEGGLSSDLREGAEATLAELAGWRFFEPQLEQLRRPAVPGQTRLGDGGQNLSAVLQEAARDARTAAAICEWLRALTPLDVSGLGFETQADGRVALQLQEPDGRVTSIRSASDGTLRFLAYAALLLAQPTRRLYVLEEVENGIHPSRVRLLLDLLRSAVREADRPQVLLTTHSAQTVSWLDDAELDGLQVTYRPEDRPDAVILRPLDWPDAERVLRQHDRASLYATEWFEHHAAFAVSEAVP